MKTAVVAYEMEGDRTGVGRYLEGLLSGLAQLNDEGRWLLYFKGDPFDHPLWSDATRAEGRPHFEPVFDRRPRARPILWEQLRLPTLLRRDRPDRVFSPAYSLPATGAVPGIVTVHDLSFEVLGEDLDFKERWRRRLLARRVVRKAKRVLTDTQEMARDLMRLYRLPYEKIGVVPLGVDARFSMHEGASESSDHERLAKYGIRPPYLLFLGSILERRRVDLVIDAFARVAREHPDLSLVLAGRNRLRQAGDLERWIADSGARERILQVGYVREDDLVPLYRRAKLFYYLSTYEGYGLPPMESLAAGTPAVVGRGLALDELWPDYPYRLPTLDLKALVRVTRSALRDEASRQRIAGEGIERMVRLDWRRTAELFLDEIRQV